MGSTRFKKYAAALAMVFTFSCGQNKNNSTYGFGQIQPGAQLSTYQTTCGPSQIAIRGQCIPGANLASACVGYNGQVVTTSTGVKLCKTTAQIGQRINDWGNLPNFGFNTGTKNYQLSMGGLVYGDSAFLSVTLNHNNPSARGGSTLMVFDGYSSSPLAQVQITSNSEVRVPINISQSSQYYNQQAAYSSTRTLTVRLSYTGSLWSAVLQPFATRCENGAGVIYACP